MATNLPEAGDGATPRGGWVPPTAYDYSSYGADASSYNDWDGNARIYEWDGDQGDLGPEVPELEVELFGVKGGNTEGTAGIDFSTISEIEVTQEGPTRVAPALKFQDAGLHPAMLKNIELCGYRVPTPIQSYCMPAIHKGHDVIGIAQTGSGKTAAFLIPIINKLMGKAKKLAAPRPNPATYNIDAFGPVRAEPLVVIVCPTRELAVQIFNEARKLCYRSMLRPAVVYGGGPFQQQIRQIGKGCDILVGTPGRLIHFLEKPELLTRRRLKYMVIDEADEMLHEDWAEDFEKILSGGGKFFPFSIDKATFWISDTDTRSRIYRAGGGQHQLSPLFGHLPQEDS
jgi:ATP-dependent RNA helicase DDX3X